MLPLHVVAVIPMIVFCRKFAAVSAEVTAACHMSLQSGSDFCLKLVHAPLVDTVEELDRVEESDTHLVPLESPLVGLGLLGLGVVKLLNLGVKPQPLGGQQLTAPFTKLLTPEII